MRGVDTLLCCSGRRRGGVRSLACACERLACALFNRPLRSAAARPAPGRLPRGLPACTLATAFFAAGFNGSHAASVQRLSRSRPPSAIVAVI